MPSNQLINQYAVFNNERVRRYAWLLTSKLTTSVGNLWDRLNDIAEALEEEEPRSARPKHKQKATRKR